MNFYEMSEADAVEAAKSNQKQLFEALMQEYGFDPEDLEYGGRRVNEKLPFNFSIEGVYSEGGNEGGGEYVERVYSLKHNGKHLFFARINGNYQSYNGTEWDEEVTIVYPRQVTRTEYFPEP